MYSRCYDLIKQLIYHFCSKFISSEKSSNSPRRSGVLLFPKFISINTAL